MPKAPRVIIAERYELGELLGRGGMGEVRAGQDLRLGRPVAVKLLRADMASQPSIRDRFEAEARSAASLVHPNVVLVLDTGEDRGIAFIVMERLPGRSLADVLREAPLSIDAAGEMAMQVLGALGAAHSAGIIHRDIKPGNILAGEPAPPGQPAEWKVADFGIAKSLEMASADLTSTGMLIGTPAYLAPERLADVPASVASDIYAVGVVLYESLAGRRPFDAANPMALASLVSTGTPQPLGELRPDVTPAVVAVIARAMARHPASRFATAVEMAEALSTAGRGERFGPATASRALADTELVQAGSPARGTQLAGGADDPTAAIGLDAHTEMLPAAAVPWGAVGTTSDRPALRRHAARWAWAAAVAIALVIAVALSLGHHRTPAPVAATTPTTQTPPAQTPATAAPAGATSSLAPGLDGALQNLERQVLP